MRAWLEGLGYSCDVCDNGREAVEQFDKRDYVMIFMDIQMPVMDGLKATTEIRRRERELGLERRPIVAISAHVMAADRQQCLDAGMDGYIPKPFKPEDLHAQLARFAALENG
jgi:CheY-like chemotaxis protein